MKPAFNFESLKVYQRALNLAKYIYTITQSWPKEHLFGITDQLRRAGLSIVLNIAEGSSRTRKDFRHFLIVSRGSTFECIPLLDIALGLKLLTIDEQKFLYNECNEISRMLSGLRKTLE